MYKELILKHITAYLQKKGIKVDKFCGINHNISCPSCNQTPVLLIPNNYKISCCKCQEKFTLIDLVRNLEPDKKDLSEEDILQYLKELLNIDVMTKKDETKIDKLLAFYVEQGFDFVPVAKNAKNPIEKGWTTKSHKSLEEVQSWVINGLNIGVKTGKQSNITVIDIDTKEIPEILKNCKTLVQNTNKGYHYFFKYEADLPKTRIDEFKIDIENDGGQVVIFPSVVEGKSRTMIVNEIITMPKEVLKFFKDNTTVPLKTNSEKLKEDIDTGNFKIRPEEFELINNNLDGSCNSSFIKLGGVLRKELNSSQTEFVLQLLNNSLLEKPMDRKSVTGMCTELEKYGNIDEREMIHSILKYLKEVKVSTKSDLELVVSGNWTKGEAKKRLNKIIRDLENEGRITQFGKKIEIIEDMDWQDTLLDVGIPVDFKVPYFHDYAYLNWSDIVIIASKTKFGKSHLAINMVKRLVDQGIKPYYLYSETGGRFAKIALHLGLKEGDFFHAFIPDTEKVILPKVKNSVIIFDWIRPNDFAKTDKLFAGLIEKIKKTNCFMMAFMQLKKDNSYFAENLLAQYPALVSKYLYENEDKGDYTKFHITEIRDGKLKGKKFDIPCHYDFNTKEVKTVSELDIKKDKND